ncbi:dirigent protein 21-like [Telopea speciosissima]|uniref:dirigent protein 21-like n=1 Tax=Telopea speciosissima TaxID=54955 RepID=UPI001CC62717|nr:dirigent protein 21-like [Telopea speciosissima]
MPFETESHRLLPRLSMDLQSAQNHKLCNHFWQSSSLSVKELCKSISPNFNLSSSLPRNLRRLWKSLGIDFYFHDIVSGDNSTAINVAEVASTKTSPTGFGMMRMIDDPLTERPEVMSKLDGRVQGVYASASQSDFGPWRREN